jgi:hypothetical protein
LLLNRGRHYYERWLNGNMPDTRRRAEGAFGVFDCRQGIDWMPAIASNDVLGTFTTPAAACRASFNELRLEFDERI